MNKLKSFILATLLSLVGITAYGYAIEAVRPTPVPCADLSSPYTEVGQVYASLCDGAGNPIFIIPSTDPCSFKAGALVDEFNAALAATEESIIEAQFHDLLEEAEALLADAKKSAKWIVERGETKFVTEVSQLYTNAQEATEGPIENLIDGDLSSGSFWHSDWHGTVTDDHYLQVELPREYQNLVFYYVPRWRDFISLEGWPLSFRFDYCDEPDGEYVEGYAIEDFVTADTAVTKYEACVEYNFAVKLPAAAKYIRIFATKRYGNMSSDFTSSNPFWHACEINFYELLGSTITQAGLDFEAAINAARKVLASHTATEEDIENLREAYDAFLAVYDPYIPVTLTEKVPYENTSDVVADKVTYKRTFTSDAWQALYLPFRVPSEEWSEYGQVAELNAVHQYFGTDGSTTLVVEVRKLHAGESVQPNTPYVFKVNSDYLNVETEWGGENREVKAAANGQVWCASARNRFTITGVYERTSFADKYAIANGEFVLGGPTAYVDPFRIILTVESENHGYGGGEPAVSESRPSQIRIVVEGEDTTTGIGGVETATRADAPVYDLQGRRVSGPHRGGMYIVDGRKVIR